MNEEWRAVVGYEGFYEVSSLGRVRNIKARRGTVVGKIHRPRPYGNGKRKQLPYWAVALRKDGKSKNFNVAHLVASAFIGPRPDGYEVNHKDSNKAHNDWDNLEYVLPVVNKQKAWADGTYWHRGEKHKGSKLTDKDVLFIWSIRNDGYAEADVANHYGVSYVTIGGIWRKKHQKHLLEGEPRDVKTKLNRWSPRKEFKVAA